MNPNPNLQSSQFAHVDTAHLSAYAHHMGMGNMHLRESDKYDSMSRHPSAGRNREFYGTMSGLHMETALKSGDEAFNSLSLKIPAETMDVLPKPEKVTRQ